MELEPTPVTRSNYRGLALAEALRDWTVTMHWISWTQRLGDRLLQFLGLKPSPEFLELQAYRLREARRQREVRELESLLADHLKTETAHRGWDTLLDDLKGNKGSVVQSKPEAVVDRDANKPAAV